MTSADKFMAGWRKYFGAAELPITYYYSDDLETDYAGVPPRWRCFICDLGKARRGISLAFDINSISCMGGERYSGFTQTLRDNFEYFLSCGIPGELEGERYKKSPEIVKEIMKGQPPFKAPGKYLIFKRLDKLAATDKPIVVVFFASPDIISGLFTLANYDETDRYAVTAPFGAGCSSVIYYPYHEYINGTNRPVLGMFDVSARPCVPPHVLTLAVTWPKFERMAANMDESFLITDSWAKVQKRIERETKKNSE
jgi:hypothetical protein